jgi:hypothetical protein
VGLGVRRNKEPGALTTPPPPIMGHWAESNIGKKRKCTRVVQGQSDASVGAAERRVRNRTQTREFTVEPIDFGASDRLTSGPAHRARTVVSQSSHAGAATAASVSKAKTANASPSHPPSPAADPTSR